MRKLKFLKVLNSPFKPFKLKWYAGKTQVGVPYFYPRKWVKYNEDDIQKAIDNHKSKKHLVQATDEQLYDMYKNYSKAVPLKVGFSYCGLGWKTKWTNTDFRHEWNPVLSFVFFGYQIALTAYHECGPHYWECWLYYEYATDKTKRKRRRVWQCRKKFPQTWTSSYQGKEETIDYYERVLKSKYQIKQDGDK